MNPLKSILLTFDYEPYLGAKSGTAQKCILEPTEALRKILNIGNAKAVFFVDVLYLLKLKKHAELTEHLDAIVIQLKTLFKEGHYIFPHIHPHWLDAVYLVNEKQFSLTDLTRYSLANLEPKQIKNLFTESIKFLNEIGISYSNWGYRAGGWCMQPFDLFKNIFTAENIKYEFSVLPGYKNDNENQAFDFSNTVINTPYTFSDSLEKIDINGSFIEFPISTIEFNKFDLFKNKLIKKYLWKTNDRGWGDGISAQTTALKSNFTQREMVSIDVLTIDKLTKYKKHLFEKDYMHWISHPKMFTKHSLKMFENFLEFSTSNYDVNFDFKLMYPEKNK